MTAPYVILKGLPTAKFYPDPWLRQMGDIDIMPRREDYAQTCDELLKAGWREIENEVEKARGRHRLFIHNGFIVEVHAYFAYKNDPEKARQLDDLILGNINPSHELPDLVNGLVLLDHINHHMEEGLGLRQIIDWMMYVDRCLPDEKWAEFCELAKWFDLERLAVFTTRMCEMYLGLGEHRFCSGVDEEICVRFMDYVLACGNFGNRQEEGALVSKGLLGSARTPGGAFRYLQDRGMLTWPAARKYSVLRPLAWIHQAFRYLKKGLRRRNTLANLRRERQEAKKRNVLFDALGVSRQEKGIVRYRDGEYRRP